MNEKKEKRCPYKCVDKRIIVLHEGGSGYVLKPCHECGQEKKP